MKTFILMIQVLGLFTLSVFGTDEASKSEDSSWSDQARLSPAGIRRVQENTEILKKSIETTQQNIQNSKQNLSTLDTQLSELQKLEEEVLKLKTQYEGFLSQANQEQQKNKEAMSNLPKMADRKLAELEKEDRENWKKSTDQQVVQVKTLLAKLSKDLVRLAGRKKDLLSQKEHWTAREKAHQTILEELNTKKSSAEKKLKGEG